MSGSNKNSPVSAAFSDSAVSKSKQKAAPPFSLRFTPEEREKLDAMAGNQPLGRYIRNRLLGPDAEKRRVSRRPHVDQKQVALVLAELGNSRLSSNVNQLAKSANCGTLDVSEDVEQQLQDACDAIIAMRACLMIALGLKPDGSS